MTNKKSLTKKVLETGKNSWKALPLGSLIDYKNKKEKQFYNAMENNEDVSKYIKSPKKENMKKFFHSGYAIAGTALLSAWLFAGLNGNAWKPKQAINYLNDFSVNEQIQDIKELDKKYNQKQIQYEEFLNNK
ncbi:MAG TPA: hypothetical protein VJ912_00555 [Candidatus Nanoarchaeia archaeon]|nr:hypothetical protein [Candidatus Nanoarchaeia archaeon]